MYIVTHHTFSKQHNNNNNNNNNHIAVKNFINMHANLEVL